jgi:hypothetical protein
MRPTNRFFLFALITFFLFGTVPTVLASEPTAEDFTNAFSATCADPAMSHFGEITSSSQVDYYAIDLVAGQFFTIDVDAEKIDSPLDAILEVFDAAGELVAVSVESSSGMDVSPDPYLEMFVDVGSTYYLAISAETPGVGADTGSYTLLLTCSAQPPAPEFTWPLKAGDLIGSTGSTGSLINITPETAESSLPFDLAVGQIADIEYQFVTHKIFVVVNDSFGSIVAVDPDSGAVLKTFSLALETEAEAEAPTVVTLEAAGNELYGVRVDPDTEKHSLVLVTFDETVPTDPKAKLTHVAPLAKTVYALAYHSDAKVMYGVVAGAAGSSGSELVQIDLTSGAMVTVGDPQLGVMGALDFSHENSLFGVDLSGNLHEIDHATGQATFIGKIDVSPEVSGLTFVVGAAPGGVDPVGTICSSTLTTSASTSSGTADPKLSRFKLKKNPLHRAIGLFKFEGMQGETVTLKVELDGIESAEAVAAEESTASSELENSLMNHWKGKGRVFLGIRDAIPGLDFRERKKEHIPFDMSATLPADGTYYVMLIRPLLRYYQTDYCLSLTSDLQEDSQAWKTFEVAWPNDESGDDTACTTAEESKDVQNDTETLAGASADDGSVSVTLSTTAIAPTSAPPEEPVVETPVEADPAAEGGDTEGGQTLAETPVVEPVAETPVAEPVAEIPVVEPVAETPVVEPVVETPVAEPVAEPPVVEPVVETPVAEPVAEPPVVEPVAEPPVVEPVVEPPVVEPVVEIPVVTEPAAGGTTTEELIEPVVEALADTDPDGVGVR